MCVCERDIKCVRVCVRASDSEKNRRREGGHACQCVCEKERKGVSRCVLVYVLERERKRKRERDGEKVCEVMTGMLTYLDLINFKGLSVHLSANVVTIIECTRSLAPNWQFCFFLNLKL